MRRRGAAVGLVVLGLLLGTAGAGAVGVDREEFRRLAERARTDPDAIAALRDVDRVDGRPVDVPRALGGAEGEELRRRLEVLATAGEPGGLDAAGLREWAGEILASEGYRGTEPAGGAEGLLRRVAGWFGDLAREAPLGAWLLWGAVAVLVVVGATVLSRGLVRRRGAAAERVGTSLDGGGRREDPGALEREAAAAEDDGDLVRAVRLLFRAGLLRLDAAGVLRLRPSVTVGEVSRRLGPGSFDRLARFFDEVVYGGRTPSARELEAVRRGWDRVLGEARR